MSNATFDEILEYIKAEKTFAVCGHVNPDGDSIGSVLGMVALLRQMGKEATPLLSNSAPAPEKYAFLEGYGDFVHAADYKKKPDVFIAVDTPNADRIGSSKELLGKASKTVAIDHHPSEEMPADLCFIDPTAASASILVWEFARLAVEKPSAAVAMACYTGLITDTGRFQFQNTDKRALERASDMVGFGADAAMAATEVYQNRPLGAIELESRLMQRMKVTPGGLISYSWVTDDDYSQTKSKKEDTEGLVDTIRSVCGIEIALLMRGKPDSVRCSIRAKHDIDVSVVAKHFGGGGHKAASGFTVNGSLEKNKSMIIAAMIVLENQIKDGTFPDAW